MSGNGRPQGDDLLRVLAWQPHTPHADYLWLASSPEKEERAISPLFSYVRAEQSGRPLFLMVTRDDYARAIKPVTPVPLCQVSSQPSFDVKLRNVLSRQRMPEILLLTTKCGK